MQISVQGNTVIGMAYADSEISLEEAFKRYSETYGLNVDTKGSVEEVWCRWKEAKAALPRRRGLLSKVFGKKA